MFDIPLPFYFFTKEHPLKMSLKMSSKEHPLLMSYWPSRSKFRIVDKTYSKGEQGMTLVEISLYSIAI